MNGSLKLSKNGMYFVDAIDQKPLFAQAVMEISAENEDAFPEIRFWESFWECSFSYKLAEQQDSKLILELKVRNRALEYTLDFPKGLCVDYIVHQGNFIPLRPSVARALAALSLKIFVDEDPTLSVIELLSLEYFAAENEFKLDNSELRERFFAGHKSTDEETQSGLAISPYPYQEVGIDWLFSQQTLGKPGALLCDVMGLGKTIQGIGLIVRNLQSGLRQNLVICPSTLVENWRREFKKFAPAVKPYIHNGSRRSGVVKALLEHDVVITSYDTLIIDFAIMQNVKWNVVILDEAQAIKNPDAKRTTRSKSLNRNFSVAVTGTPIENTLIDIWSLIDFANPNLLGTKSEFESRFADEADSAQLVGSLIKPTMLRRKISDVENQLPDKTVIDHPLQWPEELIDAYESVRRIAWEQYPTAGGLVATTRLRQLATHPRLLNIGPADLSELSPKFSLTVNLLEELFANNEKALIFTSYLEMIDGFVLDLSARFPDAFVQNLDSRIAIEDRQNLVDDFNNHEGPGVLICNPIVAGAGLNITGANHVIHYNLEWNPAKEDQATFRVYRNGQTRHSFVHRLFYVDTIDEVIDDRIARKRRLSDLSVDPMSDAEDYNAAVRITPKK